MRINSNYSFFINSNGSRATTTFTRLWNCCYLLNVHFFLSANSCRSRKV